MDPAFDLTAEIAASGPYTLGIMAAGLDGTYSRFAGDISNGLDGVEGLRILAMIGLKKVKQVKGEADRTRIMAAPPEEP